MGLATIVGIPESSLNVKMVGEFSINFKIVRKVAQFAPTSLEHWFVTCMGESNIKHTHSKSSFCVEMADSFSQDSVMGVTVHNYCLGIRDQMYVTCADESDDDRRLIHR